MPSTFPSNTLIILTTSPAGLGHIRVMHALKEGISANTKVVEMGSKDPSIQFIHRLTSKNSFLKAGMEFMQTNRLAESIFSSSYRKYLSSHPHKPQIDLTEIIAKTHPSPQTVIVLATHFGLAHQLSSVKTSLGQTQGVKIVVACVVTDDSPQEMWAVPQADYIFVPSNTCKEGIISHLLHINQGMPEVITVPYPISPLLAEKLSTTEFDQRRHQVSTKATVILPISGAAVQLNYYQELISVLSTDEHRIIVVSRASTHTQDFLNWCRRHQGVKVVTSTIDHDVVENYQQQYLDQVVGIEITKPSEQAFKALYTPKDRGGAVLLLSPPVGRQERDNLSFLRRHQLMPSLDDQARINLWCQEGNRLHLIPSLMERAHHWRAILMPASGTQAGISVRRLIKAKILSAMVDFTGFLEGHHEINSNGVTEIWRHLKTRI